MHVELFLLFFLFFCECETAFLHRSSLVSLVTAVKVLQWLSMNAVCARCHVCVHAIVHEIVDAVAASDQPTEVKAREGKIIVQRDENALTERWTSTQIR